MPRRTKVYIGPGKTLVDGGRFDLTEDANEETPVATVAPVDVDIEGLRKRVAVYIQKFDELAQLGDRDQFINDLVDECVSARTMRVDHITRGTRTKPDEWTAQILVSGLASVMRRHGLKAAISEYYDSNYEIRQSLYLRLIPGLIKIGGFLVPRDVKGLALRAKRIRQESVIPHPIKSRLKAHQVPAVRTPSSANTRRLETLIQAYRELDPELQAHPTGKKTIEHLRIAVIQKLGLSDNKLDADTIKRDIGQVRPILRLIQNGSIPPPGTRREKQGLSERTRLEMATGKAAVARAEALLNRTD